MSLVAGRIKEEFIEELRNRTDIVDVISGYMHLAPRGSKHWGRCPFHGEKTPSFSVDKQRQFFYCFGCHKGGNVYHFVMEQEHLEFYEAVEFLADRAGMAVIREKGADQPRLDRTLRARAVEAATEAARFFRSVLVSDEGKEAMEYLLARQISRQAIRRFGLGYAPQGWDRLFAHLSEKGFTEEEMLTAGLIVKKDEKRFDMFRSRVMFPIFSRSGQVIAFGGRIMGEGQPKYLNSAETPIFNKRRNLYALNFLKGQRNIQELLLVEGYVDVVSLASHGIGVCVATLGTAITQEQARMLKNYSQNITICYDGDDAGQRATDRAIIILRACGLEPKVLNLPGGLDPDDYVRKHGAISFMELERKDATQHLLDAEKANHDLSQPQGRTQYAMAACRILKEIDQPVVLEGFLRRLIIETGFSREVLQEQIGRSSENQEKTGIISDAPANANNGRKRATMQPDYIRAQRSLLAIMASAPDLPKGLIKLSDFKDDTSRRLAEILLQAPESNAPKTAYLIDRIGDDEELRSEAARILSEQDFPADANIAELIEQYLNVIQMHSLQEEINGLSQQIASSAQSERAALLQRMGVYMKRLKDLKDRRN
ncbi:MAG: DNA primase [Christensenellales bacterium]